MATIFLTLPSCSALSTFSIFIASMIASFSPALTSWPSATETSRSRPGIGDSRNFDRSGGSFAGISDSRWAARTVITIGSTCRPKCEMR